jgi:hypothetical protein
LIASPAAAQTIEELRDQLSKDLGESQFASSFGALVVAADELTLSGAS